MKSIKITLIISAWIITATQISNAQTFVPGAYDYYELGLLFSEYDYMGTSRIQALGGAQTALGADLSSALSNPAGLGLYNRSELSITPSINGFSSSSDYLNHNESSAQTKFNIDHFGAAFQKDYENDFGFLSGTFSISFTKVNKFNRQYNISGSNDTNDILDHFTQSANQINESSWPILTQQAFDVYLIDEFQDPNDNTFFYDRLIGDEFPQNNPVEQADQIVTTGSQNQWSISYGANFMDVFFIGAGLGIQSIRYDIEKYYEENYATGNILMDMNLLERLEVRGSGINGNFGILVRPVKYLMLGASVISPTLLTLSEVSDIGTQSNYDNYQYDNQTLLSNESVSQNFIFDYQITTPVRFNTGATVFLGKNGFITADVEFVDYSKIKFDSQSDPMEDQDFIAQSEFKNVANYKFGAEGRIDKIRIRLGYALNKSPYIYDQGINRDVSKYTFGLGYRNSKMFADLATTYQSGKSAYSPYSFAPESNEDLQDIYVTPVAEIDYNNLNVTFSLGLFF